jgi:20S proteasome alpha/beta subunit
MSLCIAVNNPGNYVIISGDGRITRGNKIVSDNHKKLTTLNSHVSMFCSGVQDYCERLRSLVSKQVSDVTPIDQIASIVKRESRKVHQQFVEDCPTFYDGVSNRACLSMVLAFYDVEKNECGMIEYCHTDNFEPHITIGSEMTARGIAQEIALDYLPNHFDPYNAIESVLNTYKVISKDEKSVGGTIIVHVISQAGTNVYEVKDIV